MKKEQIDLFEKMYAQLEALHDELSQLMKKSPDGAINQFKLKFINSILTTANTLLGEKYKPFPDFQVFEEDALPTNSDAALVVAQYISCAEKVRSDNIYIDMGRWVWRVENSKEPMPTTPPKKLQWR